MPWHNGIKGRALDLMKLYFEDKKQRVYFMGTFSHTLEDILWSDSHRCLDHPSLVLDQSQIQFTALRRTLFQFFSEQNQNLIVAVLSNVLAAR